MFHIQAPSGEEDVLLRRDDYDDAFGLREAECQACDTFAPVNDSGLCEDCAGKLERDLIRKRDWDYTASAFAVPPEKREELRRFVIEQYGKDLELLAEADEEKSTRK